MNYQLLALDLDGTLTNSRKEITPSTRDALIDIQKNGKKVVLASGRPSQGVLPLAEELHLGDYSLLQRWSYHRLPIRRNHLQQISSK